MSHKPHTDNPDIIITKDNWKQYIDECSFFACFHGYLKATQNTVDKLDAILENSQSFEALKAEIIALKSERTDFLNFAESNMP